MFSEVQGPETGGSRCPGGWAGPQNTDWRTRSWCSQAEEEEKHTVLEENKGNTEIQGGGEKTRATQRYKEAERNSVFQMHGIPQPLQSLGVKG